MVDIYRANRQFERTFGLGIFDRDRRPRRIYAAEGTEGDRLIARTVTNFETGREHRYPCGFCPYDKGCDLDAVFSLMEACRYEMENPEGDD